jgi:hypothetical protein
MGAGVVVRDHLGSYLVGCRQHMVGICPPELAEALALRRAVELARDEGLEKVIFESDCLSAVTQHTTSCYSMQVVDIILAEQPSTRITSLRVVQQKHCGSKYKLIVLLLQTKAC